MKCPKCDLDLTLCMVHEFVDMLEMHEGAEVGYWFWNVLCPNKDCEYSLRITIEENDGRDVIEGGDATDGKDIIFDYPKRRHDATEEK